MRWELINFSDKYGDAHTQIFQNTKNMIRTRKALYGKLGIKKEQVLHQGNRHILVLGQEAFSQKEDILLYFNLSEDRQWLYASYLKRYGYSGIFRDYIQGKCISLENEKILIGPYEFFVTIKENSKKT